MNDAARRRSGSDGHGPTVLWRPVCLMCGMSWLVAFVVGATVARAQVTAPPELRRPLPPPPGPAALPAASVPSTTLAISGVPYGVARIEIPVGAAQREAALPVLEVSDEETRILYPVTRDIQVDTPARARLPQPPGAPAVGGGRLLRRIGDLVRDLAEEDRPITVAREVTFLFRGDEPLRVRLSQPDLAGRTELLLRPAPAPAGSTHRQMLLQWWNGYTQALMRQMDQGDYPPIIESYLIALLSGRLDLPLPEAYWAADPTREATMLSTLKLIAGTEAIRTAILRRAAAGVDGAAAVADLPVPAGPQWQPLAAAPPGGEEPSEPTASRVPPECFYLRFGSFENYIWFRNLSEEYGGDIGRMVTLRGIENPAARRMESQLNLKTTELSRVLGASVIEDQAIIGRDLFLNDGASLGVLFRAKNTFLLRTSLESERSALVRNDPAVKQSRLNIDGHEVSLIATPDNRVRSFMAVDGEYVFVTNSRTLVRRFIEVGRSGQSLASTPEFQLARQLVPLEREDTVFAYFSPQMLRGLVGPDYLIELRRRLQADTDIALLRLARLASAAEAQPLWEIDDLIDAGFLPLGFGRRGDGSGVITAGDEILDSLRGRSGTFMPIADIEITAVTAEEDQWYRRVADYHSSQWQQMDPIVVGMRRSTSPEAADIDRLEVHAEVAPWSPEKYGALAQQLGPPTRVRIDFAPDDIVAAQAHVVSDQLRGSIPPHHLFAAIKDTVPPAPEQFDGILKSYGALRSLPGYLGAWPLPGLLDRLPLGLGRGQPVGPGMTRLVGGLYRFQGGGFSIVSFQPDVIQASLPFIAADEAEDQAQVRIQVGNLVGSQLQAWVNEQLFQRTTAASRAGADLLGLLTRQLKVDRQDALHVARELLGGELQDPLGGRYLLAANPLSADGSQHWVSTSWNQGAVPEIPPPGYLAPVLSWFRGGRANLTQYDDRIVADVVIDVQRQAMPVEASPQ